jgi:integrase
MVVYSTERKSVTAGEAVKAHLTKAVIDGLAPARGLTESGKPVKEYFCWDDEVKGLAVRVTVTGEKYFCFTGRVNRRLRRLEIGQCDDWTLVRARDKARATRVAISKGENPFDEALAGKRESTFGELAALFLEKHIEQKSPRHAAECKRILDRYLLPEWGNWKLSAITRSDVNAVLDKIADRGAGIMANRVRALLSKMFNFGIKRDKLDVNLALLTDRRGIEKARTRKLNEREIRALFGALETEPPRVAGFFKLVFLTLARRTELAEARWNEFDRDAGWWVLPADRSKNARPHSVPLCFTALAVLRQLKELAGDSEFVFPGQVNGQPLQEPKFWVDRVTRKAGAEDFTIHDLRRTVASAMGDMGVEDGVISRLLKHTPTTVTGRHYDQSGRDEQKRAAILRWERKLNEIVTGEPAPKVVAIR